MRGWTPRVWKKLSMTSIWEMGLGMPPLLSFQLPGAVKAS